MTPNLDLRDIVHDGVNPQRAADNLTVSDIPLGGRTHWNKRKVIRHCSTHDARRVRADYQDARNIACELLKSAAQEQVSARCGKRD